MLYTVPQQDVRHLLRLILPRKVSCFIFIWSDDIDQLQGGPDILQSENPEVRQLCICQHQLSRFLCPAHHRVNNGRIVKRCPEQGSQDQRPGVCKHLWFLFRMEIEPVCLVGDGFSAAVSPYKHCSHRSGIRSHNQFSVHAVLPQLIQYDLSCRIVAQGAKDPRLQSQLCCGNRFIHRLAAGIQASRFRHIAGCGYRFRIKAPDNGIHQRHSDADQIVFHAFPLFVSHFRRSRQYRRFPQPHLSLH